MEEIKKPYGHEQTKMSEDTIFIGNDPVMQIALDVLSFLNKKSKIFLIAKGNAIPNAVAVANIITEKMLNGKSKVEKINLDIDGKPGIGRMLSTIEIILIKI